MVAQDPLDVTGFDADASFAHHFCGGADPDYEDEFCPGGPIVDSMLVVWLVVLCRLREFLWGRIGVALRVGLYFFFRMKRL